MGDLADLPAREAGFGWPRVAEAEVGGAPADVDLGVGRQELDADALLDLPDLADVRGEEGRGPGAAATVWARRCTTAVWP